MKIVYIFFILIIVLSCSKKDQTQDSATNNPGMNPVEFSDSSLTITQIDRREINEFSIKYNLNVPIGKSIDEVSILYSVKNDFSDSTKSVIIGTNIQASKLDSLLLIDLLQNKKYFVKIKAKFINKDYFSLSREFITDSLKVFSILSHSIYPVDVTKGQQVVITTNFMKPASSQGITKVFLDSFQCTITLENINTIAFTVPINIPTGVYTLSLERNTLKTQVPDAINILKGIWKPINQYPVSSSIYSSSNALVDFGTCQSSTKAYMVGGRNFAYVTDASGLNVSFEDYILEYDPVSYQWVKRYSSNPKYFENPISYFYNNAIYILGGYQKNKMNGDGTLISHMYKLDLATMAWETLSTFPFAPRANAVSFQYNNEFYFGMGNAILPNPGPLNDFWKYNPATGVWTQLANFPGTFYLYSPFSVSNNKAYLFFGSAGYNNEKELWEYDILTNSWQQKLIPLAPYNGYHYSVVSQNDKLYFLTSENFAYDLIGMYWYLNQPPCWEFNPAMNDFKKISFPYINPNTYKVLFQTNNKIVLVDNPKATQIIKNNIVEFDPE